MRRSQYLPRKNNNRLRDEYSLGSWQSLHVETGSISVVARWHMVLGAAVCAMPEVTNTDSAAARAR